MLRLSVFMAVLLSFLSSKAQLVDVQFDYNNVGDYIFRATNRSKTPVYLNLYFTSIENTSFTESVPYVKQLEPGFNSLFTLMREVEEPPRFIFDIKTYRSNPLADVNLDFPYLVPFAPERTVKPFDVKNIDGFWGNETPKDWRATGFIAEPGEKVYASRQGQLVEIAGGSRETDPLQWYNTWPNSITLLQNDGSLITYKNVVDVNNKLQLNQKIHAGEILGEVAPNSSEVVLMVYHNILNSSDLKFIIPLFVTAPDKTEIVNSSMNIQVVHPNTTRALEMSKREIKKMLK